MERLISGKATFKLQVQYKLGQTGDQGKKPLIVYLHGYGQNVAIMEKKCKVLTSQLDAYHLFIQAPYPIKMKIDKPDSNIYSWYIFGDEKTYLRNLEYTSEFIQEIIDKVLTTIEVSRISLVGFSMGAYMAGYYGLSRWKHIFDIVMVGGRIKTELFVNSIKENSSHHSHQHFLAVHSKNDTVVQFEAQNKSITFLSDAGLNAKIIEYKGGHIINKRSINIMVDFFTQIGYRKV